MTSAAVGMNFFFCLLYPVLYRLCASGDLLALGHWVHFRKSRRGLCFQMGQTLRTAQMSTLGDAGMSPGPCDQSVHIIL